MTGAFGKTVEIREGAARLPGNLRVPADPRGLVVFAHGSGSGRMSPRNRFVADLLDRAGLGTLLFDLLTPEEAASYPTRFDIELLARRLAAAVGASADWRECSALPLGLYGASTGAAAALVVATLPGGRVGAVVSRGGRPDLAGPALARVKVPTLLVVGGADDVVLDLNRQALAQLGGPAQLEVVPGATHLFEEPGAIEEVSRLACAWFVRHLSPATPAGGAGPPS